MVYVIERMIGGQGEGMGGGIRSAAVGGVRVFCLQAGDFSVLSHSLTFGAHHFSLPISLLLLLPQSILCRVDSWSRYRVVGKVDKELVCVCVFVGTQNKGRMLIQGQAVPNPFIKTSHTKSWPPFLLTPTRAISQLALQNWTSSSSRGTSEVPGVDWGGRDDVSDVCRDVIGGASSSD